VGNTLNEELVERCYSTVRQLIKHHDFDGADRVTRECARLWWDYKMSKASSSHLLELIEQVTGGLGYKASEQLEPAQMVVAGTVIAWPSAIPSNARVLEVGTGLGRTCYIVHYTVKPLLYLTIDVSLDMLAVALYGNPIPSFRNALWVDDVRVVLGDAVELVQLLPANYFDHVIHDGGPNPLRNRRLYSTSFFNQLYRVLKPCGTISVFAGRSRKAKQLVYSTLSLAGFNLVEVESFPDSPATVYHARKPCSREGKA
jgi:spermidine synthase